MIHLLTAQFMLQLAYRPILEPLPLANYWMALAIPVALAVSAVYKAIRMRDLSTLPWQTLRLTIQILVLMVLAAALLKWFTDMI